MLKKKVMKFWAESFLRYKVTAKNVEGGAESAPPPGLIRVKEAMSSRDDHLKNYPNF